MLTKNFWSLVAVAAISGSVLNNSASGAVADGCCLTFPTGNVLNGYVTVYPNAVLPAGDPNPYHIFTTPPSWFAVDVTDATAPIPVGIYPAWCVDESYFLYAPQKTIPGTFYSGTLISTCDSTELANLPNHGGTPPVGPPPIVTLETWHEINYILNHKTGYYWWNVQVAINRLVGGPAPNDPNGPSPATTGYPPVNTSEVDAILSDAAANAAGWVSQPGDVVGVIFVINNPTPDQPVQLIMLEVPCTTQTCTGQIGNYVWYDANGNGCQDADEAGIPGVKVELYEGACGTAGTLIATTYTDDTGHYLFSGLCPGDYQVAITTPDGFTHTIPNVGCKDSSLPPDRNQLDSKCDCTGTSPCVICVTLTPDNPVNLNVDCGYITAQPDLKLYKVADQTTIQPGGLVTYTYRVENTGTIDFSDVVVNDDNGTPDYAGDDFILGPISLAPGQHQDFTRTVYLPVNICADQTGERTGTLITQLQPGGDIKVTFVQGTNVNDNTYGVNAIGWGDHGHKFSDLVGSDKAEFRFTDGAGNVVLDFTEDYISANSAYPSGWGTFGVSGAEGKMLIGSASDVLYASTSLTENLNKDPFLSNVAQYTVDSPALSDPNSSQWEYRMIYTVVVKASAFGANGFGGVMIASQHNSPSKIANFNPVTCGGCVVNIATAVALQNNTVIAQATASAEVCPPETPKSCCDYGKPSALAMQYTATGCAGTHDTQAPDKVVCVDYGSLPPTVYIVANDNDNPASGHIWFQGTVNLGDTFVIDAYNAGAPALAADTRIHIFDHQGGTRVEYVKFHTSCSQPLNAGDQFGSALLVDCFGQNEPRPGISLLKTADKVLLDPATGGTVTYTYTVQNTGTVAVANITVTDDNGTPADTSDDSTLGPIDSLAPGATATLSQTAFLSPPPAQPQPMCMTINGVSTVVGYLTTVDLGDSIQVNYTQVNVNDNRYGTGATAATGWPGGHKFNDLVGSDKAEFVFTESQGNVVLDFFCDYITASSTFPSGYGCLGVSGGDGKMLSGNAADVLSATTSLSDNLNASGSPFVTGYLVNSPPETSPNSGISVPAGWDYNNSYTVVVSKSAFGANGFGGVSVPSVHDSPPKLGGNNVITPAPCLPCVVNTATAAGIVANSGVPVTASATAQVCFGTANSVAGSNITPLEFKIDKNHVQYKLKNDGTQDVFLTQVVLTWPQSVNGRLKKVKLNGDVWGGATDSPVTLTTTDFDAFNTDTNRRKIQPGETKTLVLEFEHNASKNNADYAGSSIQFDSNSELALP